MPDDCRQSQRRRIHGRSDGGTFSGLFRVSGSDVCFFYDNLLTGFFLTREGWSGFTFSAGARFSGGPGLFRLESHGSVHEKPEPEQSADWVQEDSRLEGATILPGSRNSEERGYPDDPGQEIGWVQKTMISRNEGDQAQTPGSLKDGAGSQEVMISTGSETPPRHR